MISPFLSMIQLNPAEPFLPGNSCNRAASHSRYRRMSPGRMRFLRCHGGCQSKQSLRTLSCIKYARLHEEHQKTNKRDTAGGYGGKNKRQEILSQAENVNKNDLC